MNHSQKLIYLFKQLQFLEDTIVSEAQKRYENSFGDKKKLDLMSNDATKAMIYEQYKHYHGPVLARYMIIIQLFSIFERYAVDFAKKLCESKGKKDISKLNERPIFNKIKKYYTEVVDISFLEWEQVNRLKLVRDLIAHCDGYIEYSERPNPIRKMVSEDNDLILLTDGRIAVRQEFIKRSMRSVFSFFDLVEDEIEIKDRMLDFGWGHIKQFIEFDSEKCT